MPDYELFAPSDTVMQQALSNLGTTASSGRSAGKVYAVDYYGTKQVSDGANGYTPLPGVYANVRWVSATAIGLPTLSSGMTSLGATLTPLQPPYWRVFA